MPVASTQSVLDELHARGLFDECTDEEALRARLAEGPLKLYCGFDPTASSLHVGHLQGLAVLRLFARFGHRPIALVGGFTGMVGDPSGKSAERNLLGEEELDRNRAGLYEQMSRLLEGSEPIMADNRDWWLRISALELLREIGKLVSVNDMLNRTSVRTRLASDAGLSYTEFSYQILQAYDFVHLRKAEECELQVGGSDQYGNITAGTDMIRRRGLGRAFGLVWPLMTKADGTKFGKTEGGSVWLDPERTSPYAFHQFWLNSADDDVRSLLLKFTQLSAEDVDALMAEHEENRGRRLPQARLADELTSWVHGEEATEAANRARAALFSGTLEERDLDVLDGEIPTFRFTRTELAEKNTAGLLQATGLVSSYSEGRRTVESGGAYVNGERAEAELDAADATFLLLRRGRRNHALVRIED
ncbi:tyrosine--tRNA ligase [Solirubrobacter phytolaccae]|uniref:Tyrosine--tRNA ligase n=1 Tax=Solirubrobacter phytolaccae TaxID=1404360 RepID=A0A9X3N6C8_9ACTN|nr:tyrosine--tRNA ligase [Solirubrobacter phytolaccae]MDA0179124.1 tyrosine--tRNA ligase [Solirubrobacter phytolaccae]